MSGNAVRLVVLVLVLVVVAGAILGLSAGVEKALSNGAGSEDWPATEAEYRLCIGSTKHNLELAEKTGNSEQAKKHRQDLIHFQRQYEQKFHRPYQGR